VATCLKIHKAQQKHVVSSFPSGLPCLMTPNIGQIHAKILWSHKIIPKFSLWNHIKPYKTIPMTDPAGAGRLMLTWLDFFLMVKYGRSMAHHSSTVRIRHGIDFPHPGPSELPSIGEAIRAQHGQPLRDDHCLVIWSFGDNSWCLMVI